MDNFKNDIEQQMALLGRRDANRLCGNGNAEVRNKELDFILIERLFNSRLPVEYKFFYDKYGAFCFNNEVCTKSEDMISQLGWGDDLTVDNFCSLANIGKCSVEYTLRNNAGLEPGLMPICRGLPGDLICIDLGAKNYGKVYYWFHEGYENQTLFLLANNFYSFIMMLQVCSEDGIPGTDKEAKPKEGKEGKVTSTLSPELLEMLRKSGLEPKNYKLREDK